VDLAQWWLCRPGGPRAAAQPQRRIRRPGASGVVADGHPRMPHPRRPVTTPLDRADRPAPPHPAPSALHRPRSALSARPASPRPPPLRPAPNEVLVACVTSTLWTSCYVAGHRWQFCIRTSVTVLGLLVVTLQGW